MRTIDQIPESELPIVDKSRLVGEFGDNPDILDELRDLFLEHVPPLLVEIKSAFDAGEVSGIITSAHSLKGAANTYGAKRVAEASRIVESMSRDGELDTLEENIEILSEELDKAVEQIRLI